MLLHSREAYGTDLEHVSSLTLILLTRINNAKSLALLQNLNKSTL